MEHIILTNEKEYKMPVITSDAQNMQQVIRALSQTRMKQSPFAGDLQYSNHHIEITHMQEEKEISVEQKQLTKQVLLRIAGY